MNITIKIKIIQIEFNSRLHEILDAVRVISSYRVSKISSYLVIPYRVSRKLGRHTYPASSRCEAAKISARTHAPIPIGVIGSTIGETAAASIECVPNERFAKENEINKESAW